MSTSKLTHSNNDLDPSEQLDARQVREAYRAALQEEPRAMIDDAIRAAARRAATQGDGTQVAGTWSPMSTKKGWAGRWAAPLAAAATVMLTSSVVFMAVQDRPEIATSVLPSTANVATPESSKALVPVIAQPPAAISSLAAPSAGTMNDAKSKVVEAKIGAQSGLAPSVPSSKAALIRQAPAPPSPPPPSPKTAQQPVNIAPKLSPSEPPASPKISIAPQAELSAKLTAQSKSFAPKAEIASAATSIRDAPASAANEQRSRASTTGRLDADAATSAGGKASNAVPAGVPARAMSSPPTALPEASAPLASSAADAASVAKKPVPPEPISSDYSATRAQPAQLAQAASSAPAPQKFDAAKIAKTDNIESAETWIKRMLELKRQDKNKELAEEISRFRKRYPDVALPKELKVAQN